MEKYTCKYTTSAISNKSEPMKGILCKWIKQIQPQLVYVSNLKTLDIYFHHKSVWTSVLIVETTWMNIQ